MTAPWSRRALLRAAGATVALPWLVSLAPRGARAAPGPQRAVFWYVPNGMETATWAPGPGGHLDSPILAELAELADDVLVITGLRCEAADLPDPGDHARGTAAFLTSLSASRSRVELGVSVDQLLAAQLGAETPLRSLQVGVDLPATAGLCDSGYSCAYTRNLSWADAFTPLPNLTSPAAVFRRLFAGYDPTLSEASRERERAVAASVLDHVVDQLAVVERRVGSDDRQRLDAYLTGLRELEARLQRADTVTCAPPDQPAEGRDVDVRIAQLADLMVVALRCDLTRVITFMTGESTTGRSYPFLGVPQSHHDLSHHRHLPERLSALTEIGRWEVRCLARFLRALRDAPEGSLLDDTLVLFGSEMSDGNSHSHDDLPIVLAGRAGGGVAPGRLLARPGVSLSGLHAAVLDTFGVPRGEFAPRVLSELTGLSG